MKTVKLITHHVALNYPEKQRVLDICDQLSKQLTKINTIDQDLKLYYNDSFGRYGARFMNQHQYNHYWRLSCSQFHLYTKDESFFLRALKSNYYQNLIKISQSTGVQIDYYQDDWVLKWTYERFATDLYPSGHQSLSFCLKLWHQDLANLDDQQIATISRFINDCKNYFVDQNANHCLDWKQIKVLYKNSIFNDWKDVDDHFGIVFALNPQSNNYQATLHYTYTYDYQLVDPEKGDFDYKESDDEINFNDCLTTTSPGKQFLNDPQLLKDLNRPINQANPINKSRK